MKTRTFPILIFLILATLPIAPTSIYADQMVVGFTATVWLVDDASCQCVDFEAGEPLFGYYSFESGTPDDEQDPKTGEYRYSAVPSGMVVWVAQHEFRSDSANMAFTVWVLNDHTEPQYDKIIAYEDNPIHPQNLPADWLRLDLRDDTGTLLGNDSLVLDTPNVEEWTSAELVIMGQGYQVGATIHHMFASIPTAVHDRPPSTVNILNLSPASPNPFSDQTTVNFELNAAADVNIDVFDVTGRLVHRDRINGVGPGIHQIPVRLQSGNRGHLPGGVYLYRVQAGGEVRTSKFVVVR